LGGAAEVMDLREALERTYDTDAHVAAYATSNGRRLTREALDRSVEVPITCCVFDLDCPEAHGTATPPPRAWRRDVRARVLALAADHPDPWYYETRAGARIVFAQECPTVLRSQNDATQWSRDYAVVVAYLEQRYGLLADPACADWQRLFRLPRVIREGGTTRENHPVNWMPDSPLGVLLVKPTRKVIGVARKRSRAFAKPAMRPFQPRSCGGQGLLFHLLRARGDILREHGAGAYVIRCPREEHHTSGRTGDGSTVLYLPGPGNEVGVIHCLHSHCSGLRARDWIDCFAAVDVDEARRAAAIDGRASR